MTNASKATEMNTATHIPMILPADRPSIKDYKKTTFRIRGP